MSTHDLNNSDSKNNNVCLNDIAEFLISRDEIDSAEFEQLKGYLSVVREKAGKDSPAFPYLDSACELIAMAEKEGEKKLDYQTVEVLGRLIENASYELDDDETDAEYIDTKDKTESSETEVEIDLSPESETESEEREAIASEEKQDDAEASSSPDAEAVAPAADESKPDSEIATFDIPDFPEETPDSNPGEKVCSMPDDIDADFLSEFATESEEYLEQAEASLLTLETDPKDDEAINSIFRAFHTIKGTSGFLGLTQITELAHVVESMLGRVRDGSIKYTEVYADVALQSIDVMKSLTEIAKVGSPGQELATPAGLADLHERLSHPDELEADSQAFESDAVDAAPRLGDIIVAENIATREQVEDVASTQAEDKLGIALVKSKTAKATEVVQALRTQTKIAGPAQTASSTLRVRTDRLDLLIETVGELVIAQSMVSQDETVCLGDNHKLLKKVGHSGKIVRELQDLSMSMRMVPLKATFQKMARLVRDAAQKSGKSVQLITQGEDEEIDRNMVDVISDPLVHMIRNAVDHGIEAPEHRSETNKPALGTIRLSALRAGSNVLIKIEDDGAGLRRERIVKKAIEKGLIETDKGMTDSEVFELIFRPGFSTVENVTDLSGRGVGMDVVKRGVDALGGRINIVSEVGKGTEFTMQLPLTMAITDGMLVKVGKEYFIIPTININRSFRPNAEQISTVAGRGEMVLLHGQVIPVYRLYEIFGVKGAIEDMTDSLLVIVGDEKTPCAFMVDELLNQQQVVAKPIGDGLGKVPGVSGGAILGDGHVGLILDTIELATMARQSFRTTKIKQSSIFIKDSNGQKTETVKQ